MPFHSFSFLLKLENPFDLFEKKKKTVVLSSGRLRNVALIRSCDDTKRNKRMAEYL